MPTLRSTPGLLAVLGICLLPWAVVFADESDAVAVVAGLHEALIDTAAAEPPQDLAGRTQTLAPVLTEAHDFAWMGRITVRRFWNDWSDAQRQTFLDAFERLSVATYASRFAGVGPDTFAIVSSEAISDDSVEVNAVIHRQNDTDVSMDYTLRLEDDRWRIINVVADGASELSRMASEYFGILSSGSFDDLIADLESRIATL